MAFPVHVIAFPIPSLTAYGVWLSQGYDIIDSLGTNFQLYSARTPSYVVHVIVTLQKMLCVCSFIPAWTCVPKMKEKCRWRKRQAAFPMRRGGLRHPDVDYPASEARDLGNLLRDSDRQQFILRSTRFLNDNMDTLSRDDCCNIYEQCFEFSIFSFFTLYDRSKLQKVYPSGDNSLFGHHRPRSDAKPQSPRETA